MLWKKSLEGCYWLIAQDNRLYALQYDKETRQNIGLCELNPANGEIIKKEFHNWPLCIEKEEPYADGLNLYTFRLMDIKRKHELWKKSVVARFAWCYPIGNVAIVHKSFAKSDLDSVEAYNIFNKRKLWGDRGKGLDVYLPGWSEGIYVKLTSGIYFVDENGNKINITKEKASDFPIGIDRVAFSLKEEEKGYVVIFDGKGKEVNRINPYDYISEKYSLFVRPNLVQAEHGGTVSIFKFDGSFVGSFEAKKFVDDVVVGDKRMFFLLAGEKRMKCVEDGKVLWDYPCQFIIDACSEAVLLADPKNALLLTPEGKVIRKFPRRGFYLFVGSTLVRNYINGEKTIVESYKLKS
jgi:hypothetical protein